MRSLLYALSRFLGDWNAYKKGRVLGRIKRRLVGRYLAGWIGKIR